MMFTISDFITCFIQLISFIVYVLVIILLISFIYRDNCGVSTEFYIHFIVNGIVDILSNVLDICIRRFLTWGLFYNFYHSYLWIGNLSPVIYYSTVANCAIGIVIITFNRFMQMNYPLKYKSFWTKKVTIVMICFQIITPYISYLYLFKYEVILVYSDERNYYYHSMKDKNASWYNSLIICIWSGLTFLISFILNFFNIRKYIKIITNKKSTSDGSVSKIYLYSFYCFLISISLLLVLINSFIKLYAVTFSDKSLKELANFNYEWIILLMTCCHPFLILFLSKDMRKRFFKFYGFCHLTNIEVVPIQTFVRTRNDNTTIVKKI